MTMPRLCLRFPLLLGLAVLLAACARDPAPEDDGLLSHVPGDTPYVFANTRKLPAALGEKLAGHYAAQLAVQRAALGRLQERLETSGDAAARVANLRPLFAVLDALFAEFDGRDSAAALRELGIEPVTRSVIYGIGPLPALRIEIADADRLNALLDRVEQRAGFSASRAERAGQPYRRIDLGPVDAVLAVTPDHLLAGLLADGLFERYLPLLLGQERPEESLLQTGALAAQIERHGFTGHGEGFVRLDALLDGVLGRGAGRTADVMRGIGASPLPASDGCIRLGAQLLAGMPRLVVGVTRADEQRLAVRGVWESTPTVAAYLQKLAAPVPGVGAPYDGLLAVGAGIDLPQLRNAIDALLRQLLARGEACEWVDTRAVQAVIPRLNLALGPLTAGIRGFHLRLDDLAFDPRSRTPVAVRAGLLAAVDDPRGLVALGALFNPALAALEIPSDGTPVPLPAAIGPDGAAPPMSVAIRDKALLLTAGDGAADLVRPLLDAETVEPAPLVAVDYGIHRLVTRFGGLFEELLEELSVRGETATVRELEQQLQEFRLQAALFERLSVSVHASAAGLVVDQVMTFR